MHPICLIVHPICLILHPICLILHPICLIVHPKEDQPSQTHPPPSHAQDGTSRLILREPDSTKAYAVRIHLSQPKRWVKETGRVETTFKKDHKWYSLESLAPELRLWYKLGQSMTFR